MIKKIKKHSLLILIITLSLIGLIIRILFLWKNSAPFTYDQGRDLLDLREMVVLKKLRLIGATTSLHGVFFGPFWYWLAIPFYILTKGNPFSTLIPLLLLSFIMPIIFFLSVKDKYLGLILGIIYIFSNSYFFHSILALNTNPIIFIVPLFLIFLARFYQEEKEIFLWLAAFLMGISFHFEVIVSLLLLPTFLLSVLYFKKLKLVLEKARALIALLIPFLPQAIFELRHNFLQTKTVLNLFTGGETSLTPASGGLAWRFFDRLKIFKGILIGSVGQDSLLTAIFLLIVVSFLILRLFSLKPKETEKYYFTFISLIALLVVFIGFTIYPYALWSWYLGSVDALVLTIIGLGLFFVYKQGRYYKLLSFGLLIVFLFLHISKYFPWPLKQEFNPDPANLKTRLKIVDLIYQDSKEKGMNIFTFAPYVYDYPYQYLIWWRAKSKYNYLPEEYFYLPNQPKYVVAKTEADQLIPSKKAQCTYLIIEPFESQKEWYEQWRANFPEDQKTWTIGVTKVEKLCQ